MLPEADTMKSCKICQAPSLAKYRIRWDQPRDVYECQNCGFHFLDALDDEIYDCDHAELTPRDENYIRNNLQSHTERFAWQINLLTTILRAGGAILDVGAGGGLFLHLAQNAGFRVFGSEPSDVRLKFAEKEYGLQLNRETVDHPVWDEHLGKFDAVTLWDVIEHVNDPRRLLARCRDLLAPGGFILIDTPARDSLFYTSGELSYHVSGGRWPFLLKTMYSPMRFGHKQIFRISEIVDLLRALNFDVLESRRFHELSFPRSFYLRRLLGSELAVKCADPFAKALLSILPVKNKMVIVARLETIVE